MSSTQYSNEPIDSINEASLKSTRFLLPEARLLPYRNAAGEVHLGLLEKSMKLIGSGKVTAPPDVVERASKWLKHCRRHFAAHPTHNDDKPKVTPITAGASSKSQPRVSQQQQQQQQQPAAAAGPASSRNSASSMAERRAKLEALAQARRTEKATGASEHAADTSSEQQHASSAKSTLR